MARSSLLAAVVLLLALVALGGSSAAPTAHHRRRLSQLTNAAGRQQVPAVNAFASSPVSINGGFTGTGGTAGTREAPALLGTAAGVQPGVQAAGIGKGQLLGDVALGKGALIGGLIGGLGAAQPSTVVVVPTPAAPVLAAPVVPTTTILPPVDGGFAGAGQGVTAGSLNLSTSSPVHVSSPVNVSTPVRQSSSQKGPKILALPGIAGGGKKAGAGGANALGAFGAGIGLLNLLG
jgi:hypothetical protein